MSSINLPMLANYSPKIALEELTGAQGTNREVNRKCQFKAVNDWEAIQVWLDAYQHKPATYKQFQKEAERLLL